MNVGYLIIVLIELVGYGVFLNFILLREDMLYDIC